MQSKLHSYIQWFTEGAISDDVWLLIIIYYSSEQCVSIFSNCSFISNSYIIVRADDNCYYSKAYALNLAKLNHDLKIYSTIPERKILNLFFMIRMTITLHDIFVVYYNYQYIISYRVVEEKIDVKSYNEKFPLIKIEKNKGNTIVKFIISYIFQLFTANNILI